MEENREAVKPRPGFEDLSNPEKVRAILGAVNKPVTRNLALELSRINLNELSDEERGKVEAVFGEEDIEKNKVDDQERYRLSDDARGRIGEKIDMKSVHRVIIDRYWDGLEISF